MPGSRVRVPPLLSVSQSLASDWLMSFRGVGRLTPAMSDIKHGPFMYGFEPGQYRHRSLSSASSPEEESDFSKRSRHSPTTRASHNTHRALRLRAAAGYLHPLSHCADGLAGEAHPRVAIMRSIPPRIGSCSVELPRT